MSSHPWSYILTFLSGLIIGGYFARSNQREAIERECIRRDLIRERIESAADPDSTLL